MKKISRKYILAKPVFRVPDSTEINRIVNEHNLYNEKTKITTDDVQAVVEKGRNWLAHTTDIINNHFQFISSDGSGQGAVRVEFISHDELDYICESPETSPFALECSPRQVDIFVTGYISISPKDHAAHWESCYRRSSNTFLICHLNRHDILLVFHRNLTCL